MDDAAQHERLLTRPRESCPIELRWMVYERADAADSQGP